MGGMLALAACGAMLASSLCCAAPMHHHGRRAPDAPTPCHAALLGDATRKLKKVAPGEAP